MPARSLVINEIHADPDSIAGDANGDSVVSTTQDEFVEIVNHIGSNVDMSGWTLHDGIGLKHTFPANTILSDGCGVVVFAGGTPAGRFGGSLVQTASSGSLGLNNTGDTIALFDQSSALVVSYTYGSEGGDNQSLTRDPDVIGAGPLVKHSTASGSGGALFSPGTRIDGSLFAACPVLTPTPTGTQTPTPAGIPQPGLVINEIHADPDSVLGDANGDGVVSTTQDEFVEIVDHTGAEADLSGWTLHDGIGLKHTFPANTRLVDGCAVVVFAGGAPTGSFGSSLVQTASSGSLGLNNTGDTVTLVDLNATPVASYTYGGEGGDNQSLTRDPDVIGPEPLVKHSTASGSNGTLFSPGTRVNDAAFAACPTTPPTPTSTPTPSNTPTDTPTPTPSSTPTATSSSTPTGTLMDKFFYLPLIARQIEPDGAGARAAGVKWPAPPSGVPIESLRSRSSRRGR